MSAASCTLDGWGLCYRVNCWVAQLFGSLGAAPAPLAPVLMLLQLLPLLLPHSAGCLQALELDTPALLLVLEHSQATTGQRPHLVVQYPRLPQILIQLTTAL